MNLEQELARVTLGDVKGSIWGDISLRLNVSFFNHELDGLDGDPSLMGPPSLWAPLISFICLLADRRGVMCNRVLKGMDEG